MPFKPFFLSLLLITMGYGGRSQSIKLDSLESAISKLPGDSNRVNLLNKYVTKLREVDIPKAELYALQAETLAEKINYTKGVGQAYENLGWLNYRKGEYSKAFEITTEAIRFNKELKNYPSLGRCFNTIAAINFEQQQYNLAIQNFKEGYRYAHLGNDVTTSSRSLNNIAFCFISQHQTDSAKNYAIRALAENKARRDRSMNGFTKRILGDVFLEEGNVKQAIENYKSCLDFARQENNNSLLTSTLHRLGKAYNMVNQPNLALPFLLQNIDVAQRHGYRDELERSYKLASEAYLLKKDLIKAYEYQSKYVVLHDSIYNIKNSERVSLKQVQFDTEMKQAQIDLLTKDAELRKHEIKRQQAWILLGIGCFSLLLLLAFVLYYNNKRFVKVNSQLEKQNLEVQRQATQMQHLNTTKDKLFSIISHDLRSPIARLKALMEIFSDNGLTREEFLSLARDVRQNIDAVYDDLDNLLQWAQSQLRGFQSNPSPFELYTSVEEKVSLFKSSASAKQVKLINEVDPGTVLYADRQHIGLVLRNLIANAVKFSSAGETIRITARMNNEHVEVSVTDEGIGISNEDQLKLFNGETHFTRPGTNREKGVGIGLLITKEFIEHNGGMIWVESEVGKGSTFTFSIRGKVEENILDLLQR